MDENCLGCLGWGDMTRLIIYFCLPASLQNSPPTGQNLTIQCFIFSGRGIPCADLAASAQKNLAGGGGRWLSVLSGLFSFKWKHLTSLSYLTIETSLDRSLRLITSAAKGSWVLNWDLENATKSVFLLCNSAKVIQLIKRKIVGLVIRSVKMNYMTLV